MKIHRLLQPLAMKTPLLQGFSHKSQKFTPFSGLKENGFYADAGVAFQAAYQYAPNWKANQAMLAYAQRKQRPIGLAAPPQTIVFQQQGVNPNIPADPSPFRQIPSSRKSP
jgi:hypothetical protein